MARRIVVSGVLGGIVLILCAFVANAFFGLRPSIGMRTVANEPELYKLLSENAAVPGGYIVNPPAGETGEPEPGRPVFSVRHSGVGHDDAGQLMIMELVIGIVAAMIATYLLTFASDRIAASYLKRVLFFSAIGLLLAVFSDLTQFGIGGYPLQSAVLLAVNSVVSWTLVGVVVGALRPPRPVSSVPA